MHQINGSLVALVTPMTTSGRIDSEAYTRLLRFHLDHGTHGVVIGGTTGESAALSNDELQHLVSLAVGLVAGRIPVIAGTGTNDTRATIARTAAATAAGADACLVVTPYYNKPTQGGLRAHFEAVAEQASVPLVLYNVPGRTAVDLLPGTVAELARHPRIVALKDATASVERTRQLLASCGENLTLLSGDDATALQVIQAGARGVISVSANIAPRLMSTLCEAALDGDMEHAKAIDKQLQPLHQQMFIESNPIPVKFALHEMGLIGTGIRLPMTWLSPRHHAVVLATLKELGIEVAG